MKKEMIALIGMITFSSIPIINRIISYLTIGLLFQIAYGITGLLYVGGIISGRSQGSKANLIIFVIFGIIVLLISALF